MLVKKMRIHVIIIYQYFLHESNDSDWKMIARFSTPYKKSFQVNFFSLWKIENGVYKSSQVMWVFVNTYPVYVVVITC